jgi:hypothetical protein
MHDNSNNVTTVFVFNQVSSDLTISHITYYGSVNLL